MNKLIVSTLACAASAAVLFAGSIGAADAQTSTHIIKGKIVEAPASTEYDWSNGYISLDQDYDRTGRRIGSDVTTCHAASATATRATCYASFALKEGLVTVRFTETMSSSRVHGKVIGGAGRYKHATGTVTIVEGNNNDSGPSTAKWVLRLHY